MEYVKKLGQNFLINQESLKKIIDALDIKSGETIIEVGAGSGNLTKEILKTSAKVIAIEKDSKWVDELKAHIEDDKLEVIQSDVRDILAELTKGIGNYKLVGNIPYYLTGRLLRICQELENAPQTIVLTVQKEVAERIVAKAGRGNQLSAIINLWAKSRIIWHLRPADFYPRPKVDSAVIKIDPLAKKERLVNEEDVIALVKTGFSQPRKTLFNNLSSEFSKQSLKKVFQGFNFEAMIRPQDLSRDLWIKLAKNLF